MNYVKEIDHKYHITVSSYETDIELNGKRYNGVTTFCTDIKPETIEIISKQNVTDYYEKDGEKLSLEEYTKQLVEFESAGRWEKRYDGDDDSYNALVFSDIETEVKYRHFKEDWKPVYKQIEVKRLFEFSIINVEGNTSNPFIIPFRYIGEGNDLKDGEVLYRYTANPYKLAQAISKDLGFEEVEDRTFGNEITKGFKWSSPSHSRNNMDFVKINGNYEHEGLKGSYYGVSCGTWDECNTQYNEHYQRIKKVFEHYKAVILSAGKNVDVQEVVKDLELIKNWVDSISPKLKSYSAKRTAVEKINTLTKKLLNLNK